MPNNNEKRAKTLGRKHLQDHAKKASRNSPWRKEPSCKTKKAHKEWE